MILITPLYEDADTECSYEATVTVLTRERRRNTAIVLAENVATGESLRCDVILDVIDRLGVETTTRQLYLEEAPETFVLHAEDTQGNVFTTLEGVEFNWVISSLNKDSKDWSSALRFLTFTESPYHEVPKALEKFEAQGLKGYMVLLEGINTGTAKVSSAFGTLQFILSICFPSLGYCKSSLFGVRICAANSSLYKCIGQHNIGTIGRVCSTW